MERESFVFYKSFGEVAKSLSDQDRLFFYDRVIKYALRGEDEKKDWITETLFVLVKPQLDSNNKKYKDWNKWGTYWHLGGRPKKPHRVISENPTGVEKITPNVNDNVNDNDNVNAEGFLDIAPKWFKEFWESYPKKIEEPLAISAFIQALRKTSLEIILTWVKNYKKDCKAKQVEDKFIASPANWLIKERRKDVYKTSSPTPPPSEQPKVVVLTDEQRLAARERMAQTRKSLADKLTS